jgi:ABC-2 type transport system ATP-binding protein
MVLDENLLSTPNNNSIDSSLAQQITRRMPSVVFMERLSSEEHYLDIGSEPKQILKNINIDIRKGEIWGIIGSDVFELKLLMEIMANLKPYYDGKCQLLERGMFKHKRTLHPDVFYFASTNMAYANMKVLEFLLFTTANSSFDSKTQMERLSDQLFSFGLGGICNTPIYKLSPEFKAIILLLAGYFSSNRLIIINLPTLVFCEEQIRILSNIAEKIRSVEQTLVFSTIDVTVVSRICDHTAYLKDGTFAYSGTVEELVNTYDKVVMSVKDADVWRMKIILAKTFPEYEYKIDDSVLYVSSSSGYGKARELYEKIIAEGFTPTDVKVNKKSIHNAIKELLKQNDV